jgi:ADP-ribosylglycohydrolase
VTKANHGNRVLGCIFGGAIGDAFGGPYEGSASPVRLDEQATWRLSDDTQLTLATCEAITQTGRVDPAAIADRFKEWFQAGRLSGLGASTLKAVTELLHGGHWALVGRKGEMAAGNGAAMRIAPLALLLDPADADARRTIRDVCRITHHHDEAYVGALAILTAVHLAWTGKWSGGPGLIEQVIANLPDSRVRDQLREIDQCDVDTPIVDLATRFGNSGYVVESVPLALSGASRVRSLGFRPMLEQLVAGGGDTDTIASMAGQIAGTLLGYDALPAEMVSRLPDAATTRTIAEAFAKTR